MRSRTPARRTSKPVVLAPSSAACMRTPSSWCRRPGRAPHGQDRPGQRPAACGLKRGLTGGEDLITNHAVRSERRRHKSGRRCEPMSEAIIETRNLSKQYVRDEFKVDALKDVTLRDRQGRMSWRSWGPRARGKSTAAAPDRGNGPAHRGRHPRARPQPPGTQRPAPIAHWRNEHVGFIFSSFNLIPVLTALARPCGTAA